MGARDGLQNEKAILDVPEKVELITRLEACGVTRQEVVSFVNPRRVPQMAGAEEIMAALPPRPGVSRIGLVLNERGWDRCVAAKCDEANVVVCASNGFAVKNQGSTVDEQVAVLGAIVGRRAAEGGPPVSLTISVAFGDPYDGEVSEGQVVEIAAEA
ncbi:MAG: hydroxymethylglutaryl-CoA lyase, partial [Caulobacter sp.]|nr:hydroxymethylglutaryl-CoA lyase [Caulobacter sp.]